MGDSQPAMISIRICVKDTRRQSELLNREMESQLNG